MNMGVKVMVLNSLVLSLVRYVIPLLINMNSKQIKIIHNLVMKTARTAIGYHSYYWSNSKVLKTCVWFNGVHLLYYGIISFIHKCNFEKLPLTIVDRWNYNTRVSSRNNIGPISNKDKSKTKITGDLLLYKRIFLYSKIPDYMKIIKGNKFKSNFRIEIPKRFPNNRMVLLTDYR